jgi:hypothetical protein
MESQPMLCNIPFSGFYDSLWSGMIDSEVDSFAEYENELQESQEYHPETFQPQELRVDVSKFAWEHMHYQGAYLEIAKNYAEAFGRKLDELAYGVDSDAPPCDMVFNRMYSPKYYNFETDEIVVELSEKFVLWLFAQSEAGGHAELIKTLERRHKSRDGFSSFYSWHLCDWLKKPVLEWDYHELRSLLESVFPELDSSDVEMDLYYDVSDNSNEVFNSHFNYSEFQAEVEKKRDELRGELDPAFLAGLPYRCALTPDMFASV